MRRPNGTGSIVKLSGNRRRPYMVRIAARDKYGRIVQKPLSYHAKASEAQEALDLYNRNATPTTADKLSMTVQQVFDGWSAREYRKLKPQSIASHNASWNKRVSRYAGRKMRSITLDEWQAILDEDEDEGRSQSLIHNDASLIRALCAYSMERDIITKDYSVYLDIPSVGAKRPRNALSEIEVAQLSKLASVGFPWADTALILCYTGFRISELLNLTPFSYHAEEGGYLLGGVKTDSGKNRRVPIHPKIRPYIMAWLARGGQAIFCGEDGKPLSSSQYRAKCFPPVMEQIGRPEATPHWCRHTFATMLHDAKADPITVKWLLGHSTKADITAHYTHESMSALWDAVKRLA